MIRSWMTHSRLIWFVLVVTTGLAAFQFVRLEGRNAQMRQDLAAIQDIRYGLFNVDEWKRAVAEIIEDEIESFELNENNRAELQSKIEGLLYGLVATLETNYREENAQRLLGFVRGLASDLLGVFDEMRRSVPDFAESVISFMEEPENREAARAFLVSRLDEYAANTFAETNYAELDATLSRLNVQDEDRSQGVQRAAYRLNVEMAQVNRQLSRLMWVGLCVLLITLAALFQWLSTSLEIKLATATLLIWLGVGVMMPLLLVDARIDRLQFSMLGHPVTFTDQVVFFQSKSILDVVRLLVFQGNGLGSMLAGVGVLLFSVIIPSIKLGATFLWQKDAPWTRSRVGKSLLFNSAKWAMADVMVVAIFLSYLGFNGVLDDQMGKLEGVSNKLEILSTSGSTLLPGFFVFFGFAFMSIILSSRLHSVASK